MKVWIDKNKCTGCEVCIKSCPYNAIEVIDKLAILNERCTACGACIESCKQEAILSNIKEIKPIDLSKYKGVWVFAEQRDGVLHSGSLELLG